MKIALMDILQTVILVIGAFLGAIIITKTLAKWMKWSEDESS